MHKNDIKLNILSNLDFRIMLVQHQVSLRIRVHLLIFMSYFFAASHQQQTCNPSDQKSLLRFSGLVSSSQGPLNWTAATDCCSSWEGIECDDNGRITRLWLPSRRLIGNLSPSLKNLTSLSQLNLSHNSLSGLLPDSLLTSLNKLEILDLSYNRFNGDLSSSFSSNGSFPSTIETVDISNNRLHGEIDPDWFVLGLNLTDFNASNNQFSNQIPSNICTTCPQLRTLDFSSNAFSGQVPVGLGKCFKLKVLSAGYNFLSGVLPSDIYRLESLVEFSVPANSISGTIQKEMLDLTNLRILNMFSNNFSGIIPEDVGKLSQLEELDLHMNSLSGPIPTSLLNCSNLVTLILRANYLEGNFFTFDFSRLTRLRKPDLAKNYLTGNFPNSLFSCKSLVAIRVAANFLKGRISPRFSELSSLSFVSLSNNSFTNVSETIRNLAGCKSLTAVLLSNNFYNEALPSEESFVRSDEFKNLQVLALEECELRGQVPVWLAKIKTLEVLIADKNQLTGPIPYWLGELTSLFYLDLSMNQLSGRIPPQLTKLPALTSEEGANKLNKTRFELPVLLAPSNSSLDQYNRLADIPPAINLKGNQITGKIPLQISRLQNLHMLDFSKNYLSGTIPSGFSNLTNLEMLDLFQNNLNGGIPTSLKSLSFLSDFNVSYNNLTGPIPTGVQFDTFPESSYAGNVGLCGQVLKRSCPSQPTRKRQLDTESESKEKRKIITNGLVIGISTMFPVVLAIQTLRYRRMLYNNDDGNSQMFIEVYTSETVWLQPQ